MFGVGSRQTRAILHHMGVLQREGARYRLPHGFVAMGYGKRIDNSKSGQPFDVIGPECQAMIAEMWVETLDDYENDREEASGIPEAGEALARFCSRRRQPLDAEGRVRWLMDHFPSLTLTAIAAIVEVDLGLVSRYAKRRAQQKLALTTLPIVIVHRAD